MRGRGRRARHPHPVGEAESAVRAVDGPLLNNRSLFKCSTEPSAVLNHKLTSNKNQIAGFQPATLKLDASRRRRRRRRKRRRWVGLFLLINQFSFQL